MAYYKAVTATITTAVSGGANQYSDPICVLEYPKVSLEMPTFAVAATTANCNIQIEGSSTSTTSTFRPIRHQGVYSGGSGILTWEVPSSTGNYIVTCEPASYFRYIRIHVPVNTLTAALSPVVHLYRDPQ